MKSELIKQLTNDFETDAHQTEEVEFWFARELQELLGHSEWRKFS